MTRAAEWGAAAALGVGAVVEVAARAGTGADPRYALLLVLVTLAGTLPLRYPLLVGAAGLVCLGGFGTLTVAGLLAQLLAAYRIGLPVLWLPYLWLALARPGLTPVLVASLAPVAAWAGAAWRQRGQRLASRAAERELAGTLLEHTARGERARIARELHDVVAHHISMIAVQAETARLTTPGLPPAGARRLAEIGDTARAGLTEMRRLLGVLRADVSDAPQPPPVQRAPQPGLAQLAELLDEARAAGGAATRLILSGAPVPLDPGVELAAYRIVQEALTNARRHAPGAAVDVELHYAPDTLRVRVRDNGPGRPLHPAGRARDGQGHGHGLLGMRERAAAVGGSFRTGSTTMGGFVVEATLPAGDREHGTVVRVSAQ